jgi:hypothetical protein
MNAKAKTEKLSEKRKRGRPKGQQRQFIESLPMQPEGGTRTKINFVFTLNIQGPWQEADPDTQRAIMGCTEADMRAGVGKYPRGWKTVAVEVGRFMEATGADAADVLQMLADARKRGVPWADIADHYRRLRLGDREGNAWALTKALARTLDEYRRRFTKTTPEQTRAAVESLLALLDENETKASA